MTVRPGSRIPQSTKRALDAERAADWLKAQGVLQNEELAAARAQIESMACPICGKVVHPSNFAKHARREHPDGKPLHELVAQLPLAAIRKDGGTQPRAEINHDTVMEYAEAMDNGAKFPALEVFYDGSDYWLADGFHRYQAALTLNWLDFPVNIHQGTQRDAVLHSVGANSAHGLPRTNADKRRAVERLLRDDEWAKWADREIARRCGVGNRFVGDIRRSLFPEDSDDGHTGDSQSSDGSNERTYITKHGTPATMKTHNIGKGRVTHGRDEDDYPGDDVPGVEVEAIVERELVPGMRVRSLGSGTVGTVVSVNGRLVTVKTTHNGEREYLANNLVVVEKELDLNIQAKHWGHSNGMAFWMQVDRFGLDRNTILHELQAGATHVTDLRMTKDEAWARLNQLKQVKARAEAAKTPLPSGQYPCIVIDPPWPMEKIERLNRATQGKYLDYPTMSIEDIQALPIRSLAADDCHLYLWTTQRFLPAALRLVEAWDFKYQCVLPWVKPGGMTPYSWMYNVEFVIFARRGNLPLLQNGIKLSIEAPATGHSVKPDAFYEKVVKASPGPRLEMFARKPREEFVVWGNEVTNS